MQQATAFQKIKVLLVEDDEDDFLLTSELLSEISPGRYEVEWVRSPEEALENANEDCYDVCLLDYRLGSRNGLDLMKDLKVRGYKCPMILLTGQGGSDIDLLAMEAGAADYLVKAHLNAPDLERSIRYSIQQRRLEEERVALIREQNARLQAEASNKAKDEFLAVLSHELRSPLNAMLGWARLLRTNPHDEEIFAKAVDTIERNAMIQSRVVEDLLDITRIVNGDIRLTMKPVDLAQALEGALDSIRPVAEAKSISLAEKSDGSDLIVFGDFHRLQQIVVNIMSNAVKFTPEGGRVTLSSEKTADRILISVTDTGQGISKEFLPFVFERYQQEHTATTNRQGGLGLGLAIVKHLVDMHGGSVFAESEGEGRGSKFTVLLPSIDSESNQLAGMNLS